MRLREVQLKAVYNSETDNILRDFYVPALSCCRSYDRAVGFFSAAMLSYAAQGLESFVKNDGKMRLIVGAELDPEDHEAVVKGYAERERILEALSRQFEPVLTQVTSELFLKRLEALQWLVAHERLDLKVALRPRGMYHEKLGVMRDAEGDFIVFQGSANETLNALSPDFNYESLNVFRSWRDGDREHYEAHLISLQNLWEGKSKSTIVLDFPEYAKRILLGRIIPKFSGNKTELELADSSRWMIQTAQEGPVVPSDLSPFPYQRNALINWREAEYCGILNHATGAGKTFTAGYAASRLYDHMGRLFLTVAVPYQALADQWISELKKFRVAPILCSSANPGWDNELALKIDRFQAGKTTFGAAVVVNATLSSSRFQQVILRLRDSGVFLFVGDECHHHGTQRLFSSLPDNADLRLGLSATYERFEDQEGTKRLEQYYGNVVDNFTLGDAMDAGFLVPYEYHLEPVQLNVSETAEYVLISDKIRDRLRSLGSTEPEALLEDDIIRSLLFRRARLLGRLEAKQKKLIDILASRGVTSRTLVYCGEGSSPDGVEDSLSYEELQNIDVITREISRMGYRVSKFTSREPPDIRRSTLEGFRRGAIQILTAIRCLDEGIDVPSCETAFILASSRNPRQFIQRRGRVLRRSAGKSRAVLWDFLPLPPQHQNDEKHEEAILKRELSRISEFSRHSLNFRETYDKLQGLLERYDLGAEFVLGES